VAPTLQYTSSKTNPVVNPVYDTIEALMPSHEDRELESSFQMVDVCDELTGRPPAALDGPVNDAGKSSDVEGFFKIGRNCSSNLGLRHHIDAWILFTSAPTAGTVLKEGAAMKAEHTPALEKSMSPSNSNEGGLPQAAGEGRSSSPSMCT
jgi:hypothetical protein